jgi:hypothetical protein
MKTAMQELLDELERVRLMTNMNFVIRIATDLLEKEKEQIINDYSNGLLNALGYKHEDKNIEYGVIMQSKAEADIYYNQTYNQNQHIIDIMKADEDDGLYKMFDTDSDKKH